MVITVYEDYRGWSYKVMKDLAGGPFFQEKERPSRALPKKAFSGSLHFERYCLSA